MFKNLIENHMLIIKQEMNQDPKLLESLIYLKDNLIKSEKLKVIANDIKELGTASKGVYFMQLKNKLTDFDIMEYLTK